MPLHIIRQDITKLKVDAIVNTTNQEMIGYSGPGSVSHTGSTQQPVFMGTDIFMPFIKAKLILEFE